MPFLRSSPRRLLALQRLRPRPGRVNPGLPLNEIISPGADLGQGGDYAKACSHVCSDPEIFHFRTPTQIQR